MDAFMYFLIFCLGLAIGSFLNVCIYRIPAQKSLIRPGSHCCHCEAPIRPYDNIPLVSFLILGGRCRRCRAKISIRYPAVELMTALLFVALFRAYGPSLQFLIYGPLMAALLVITLIDLNQYIIPDRITIPGALVGLLCSPLNAQLGSGVKGVFASLIGFFIGGILFFLIALLGSAVFKKESMGGGDIKLAAMLGTFLGWKGALFSFFLAFFSGALIGAIVLLVSSHRSNTRVPFGPFLALGAACYVFFGELILETYWGYVSGP
ncbi:MAG: prepilin peptidase [Gemmatimonadota bacterium]|nr:MAG: prepilin peptidase [Gemmatimonadota bacterium]